MPGLNHSYDTGYAEKHFKDSMFTTALQ